MAFNSPGNEQQKGAFCMLRSQTKAGLDAVNSELAHYYKAKPNEEMEVEQKKGL